MIPKCFCWLALCTWTMLRQITGWVLFKFFLNNNNSSVGSFVSGLNYILKVICPFENFIKAVCQIAVNLFFILTTEKKEVTSESNLTIHLNPSRKSLQVTILNSEHSEELFEIYQTNNA